MTAPVISHKFPISPQDFGDKLNADFDDLTNYIGQRNNGTASWDYMISKVSPWVDVRAYGARGDGTTDDTAAIDNALATGFNVFFPPGTFMTTGGHNLVFDGQKVFGSGMLLADANGGTLIKKLSGTNNIFHMGAFGGLCISNLSISGNGLGGRAINLSGSYYGKVVDVFIDFVGGTSFGMFLTSVNSMHFENIFFGQNNFGGIKTAVAPDFTFYCTFTHITLTSTTGGNMLDLESAEACTFVGLTIDSSGSTDKPIYIHDGSLNLHFYDTRIEGGITASDYITISGSPVNNICFYGGKYAQTANSTTKALFNLDTAINVVIEGFGIQDLFSAAGRDYIVIDDVTGLTISNFDVYSTNTFDFLTSAGATTRSTDVSLKNVNYRSGAAGTCIHWANHLLVENSNMHQTFVNSSPNSSRITMINVSGTVTTTNSTFLNLISTPTVVDSGNLATFIFKGKSATPISQLANDATPSVLDGGRWWRTGGTTTITDFDDGIVGELIHVISEHSVTITHGTNIFLEGAANFAMVSGDVLTLIQKADTLWYEVCRKTTGTDPYTQYILASGTRSFTGNARLGSNWIGNDGGNEGLQFDTSGNATLSGQVLQPTQPSFLVTDGTGATDATGDGTVYAQLWPTEVYDQGGNFASDTFTAPVTGRYHLSVIVHLAGILITHTVRQLNLVTSNRTYTAVDNYLLAQDSYQMTITQIADMDANDTATVTITVSGSTKVVDVIASASRNQFSGSLIN